MELDGAVEADTVYLAKGWAGNISSFSVRRWSWDGDSG